MSAIGSSPLFGQRQATQANALFNQTIQRLSTGIRINRASDDPAGAIAASRLDAELRALDAATQNVHRTNAVVSTAAMGLDQVAEAVGEISRVVVAAANTGGLSDAEREAYQLELDSLVSGINRVADSTSFNDARLLDGSRDFRVEDLAEGVDGISVHYAAGGSEAFDVQVNITQAPETAGALLSFGATELEFGEDGSDEFVVRLSGSEGSVELTFQDGQSLDQVADTINAYAEDTGVRANVDDTGIELSSAELGSDNFVSVEVVEDAGLDEGVLPVGIYLYEDDDRSTAASSPATSFGGGTGPITDHGRDVQGSINGLSGSGQGSVLNVNNGQVSLEVDLAFGTDPIPNLQLASGGPFTAGRVEGGATFSIDAAGGTERLGLPDMHASSLGRMKSNQGNGLSLADLRSGGRLSLAGAELGEAQRVARHALNQATIGQARLGSYQSQSLDSARSTLNVSIENTMSARSMITDAVIAKETATLVRAQILQAATTKVQVMSPVSTAGVLGLLGQ